MKKKTRHYKPNERSEILHKTTILNIPENVNSVQVLDYLTQILKLLGDKFKNSTTSKSSPVSCSIQKISRSSPSASNYMIRITEQLLIDQGTNVFT
jgi:hypothetical protein